MKTQQIRLFRLAATAAALVVSTAAAGWAQSTEPGPTFGLFGAYVQPTDSDADLDTEAYGLRGGYRFTDTWEVEGSISRLNEDADVFFGDVSLKANALRSERFNLYAVFGPGAYKVESEDLEATVHAGVGVEIGLTERAYLRPEVRGRWLTDELSFDEGLVDYSLGFGWRF